MMMVALFHAVPLTIELVWGVISRYVKVAVESYRYRRSIRTSRNQMDTEIGVESAMPHIFNQKSKTQSGGNSTGNGQKLDGRE
jgi:hypothetical protein